MSDTSEPEVETKTITVTSTWTQVDTFQVPVDAEPGDLNTLEALLDLIKCDVDGAEDLQADESTAELVDWQVSGI